jgi:hypothetical protein
MVFLVNILKHKMKSCIAEIKPDIRGLFDMDVIKHINNSYLMREVCLITFLVLLKSRALHYLIMFILSTFVGCFVYFLFEISSFLAYLHLRLICNLLSSQSPYSVHVSFTVCQHYVRRVKAISLN